MWVRYKTYITTSFASHSDEAQTRGNCHVYFNCYVCKLRLKQTALLGVSDFSAVISVVFEKKYAENDGLRLIA